MGLAIVIPIIIGLARTMRSILLPRIHKSIVMGERCLLRKRGTHYLRRHKHKSAWKWDFFRDLVPHVLCILSETLTIVLC